MALSPEYGEITNYIESQFDGKTKVINLKPEHTYNELGFNITIWNVKTDNEGSWWVTYGDLPMNLYSQDKPYYFATDEIFSFHLGLMLRLIHDDAKDPNNFIEYISNGTEIASKLKRKLHIASEKIIDAIEIEEIQSIGMICREILIELIGYLYEIDTFDNSEEYKKSDVKNKGKLVIDKYLSGSKNADLRKYLKNMLNDTWDFSNSVTHSSSMTKQDASICLTMTTAVVSNFENIMDKYNNPITGLKCKECGSRNLSVAISDESKDLLIICEKCDHGFLKSKDK